MQKMKKDTCIARIELLIIGASLIILPTASFLGSRSTSLGPPALPVGMLFLGCWVFWLHYSLGRIQRMADFPSFTQLSEIAARAKQLRKPGNSETGGILYRELQEALPKLTKEQGIYFAKRAAVAAGILHPKGNIARKAFVASCCSFAVLLAFGQPEFLYAIGLGCGLVGFTFMAFAAMDVL